MHTHFVVVFLEDSSTNNIPDVLLVPFGEVKHCLRIPLWCQPEPLPIWILSDTFQNRANAMPHIRRYPTQ